MRNPRVLVWSEGRQRGRAALNSNPTIRVRGDLSAQHAGIFSDEVDTSDDLLRHRSSPPSELADINVAARQQRD